MILATDGLVSALGGEEATERLIRALTARSPAEIGFRMMRLAKDRPGTRSDDRSVCCARLCARWRAERVEEGRGEKIRPDLLAAGPANGGDAQRAS